MATEERVLSDRERTVLLLASEGLTDKEIARSLDLSRRTIGTYWERMRSKMGPHPRTQLVAKFLRNGTESSYGGLFQAWEDGVWILRPTGETIYANPRVVGLFGLTSDGKGAEEMRDRFEAATGQRLEDVIRDASGEKSKFEFRVEREGSRTVFIEMRASTLGEDKGKMTAIVLLLSDVSTLRHVSHTLDSCDATLTFVSEVSSDLIARFDTEMICQAANPSLLVALGKSREEVVGKPLFELDGVFEPMAEWLTAIETVLQDGERSTINARLPDGRPCPAYLFPEPSEKASPCVVMSLMRIPPST
ncbi:hypothetical protein BH11ARM2_BH11ARM2_34390 [soil metagenome]